MVKQIIMAKQKMKTSFAKCELQYREYGLLLNLLLNRYFVTKVSKDVLFFIIDLRSYFFIVSRQVRKCKINGKVLITIIKLYQIIIVCFLYLSLFFTKLFSQKWFY